MADPFHAYDIRGIYGQDLTDDLAERIAKALVIKYKLTKVVVGFDHRTSSPTLFQAFAKGAMEMGCDVITIGSTATPILYHACVTGHFPMGVMITASHNPKEYNGFKICTDKSQLITYEKGLNEIEEMTKQEFPDNEHPGKMMKMDILPQYLGHVLKTAKPLQKEYKIVVDCGNGVAGPIVQQILNKYPTLKVVPLYFEPDGDYPNHEANPLKPENLEDISQSIQDEAADFGFAFDGDADRCILIDDNGEVVNTDILLCVIADEENKVAPGGLYHYDLRFSKVVKEHLEELGCKASTSKVGNPYYKEKMIYEGGQVAAELSGHVMYKDNFSLDDGFYHMIKIMNYIDDLQTDVSEIVKPYKKYYQSPEINTKVRDADEVLAAVKSQFNTGRITELDGVTVEYEEFWFNIRKSNTEPVVRLRIEANTPGILDEQVEAMAKFFEEFKVE